MNYEKAVELFREDAAYKRKIAGIEPHDDYDKVLLEEAEICDAAAEAMTNVNAALTRVQAALLEAKSPEVDTPFADGFAAGLGVALKLVAKELAGDGPRISSLHKSVDGPLPEIESITTTGEENGDSYRQIIQAGIDDLAKNAEGVADGQ